MLRPDAMPTVMLSAATHPPSDRRSAALGEPFRRPERRPRREAAATLERLRHQIERIQSHRRGAVRRCPCGLAALDRALGGGFVLGGLHELIAGAPGAPTRTIALLAALRALAADKAAPAAEDAVGRPERLQPWLLYIDGLGDFYPPAAAQLGIPLERLLIVRATQPLDALWACEQALRCPAPAAVIVALPRPIDAHASRRLQLAAESGSGLAFLLLDRLMRSDVAAATGRDRGAGAPSFAVSRLRITPAADSAGCGVPGAPGASGAIGTFGGSRAPGASIADEGEEYVHARPPPLRAWVEVLKLRESAPVAPLLISL
jgi:protein ImuA